ncbi:MAG: gamma carbonic anhydrase family protein [Vallitalea sp.]|jgi:carbonic anhydrase/acetyltransferase-like protein (isoleucine patch superfamily)|nr:gamma carbonic anhydrase family protein [Vallitalea sp.]
MDFLEYTPCISNNVYISKGAHVIGQTIIEEESSIWFGAVLRGDINQINVGKYTNIQDNTTIHVSKDNLASIGSYVTIGHNCVIHGCKISDYCLIGMGSIILDGAEVGEYSIVGAGSLITSNKKFPSGVLILGSPAKVIRELTEEEKNNIIKSAKNYVETAKKYMKNN